MLALTLSLVLLETLTLSEVEFESETLSEVDSLSLAETLFDVEMLGLSEVLMLSETELLGVIAHELAHIMSGHVLYKTLLWLLVNVSQATLQLPFSRLALPAIIAALKEWDRKSELSADRAGMLVLQDKTPAFALLMKLAGGITGAL